MGGVFVSALTVCILWTSAKHSAMISESPYLGEVDGRSVSLVGAVVGELGVLEETGWWCATVIVDPLVGVVVVGGVAHV